MDAFLCWIWSLVVVAMPTLEEIKAAARAYALIYLEVVSSMRKFLLAACYKYQAIPMLP